MAVRRWDGPIVESLVQSFRDSRIVVHVVRRVVCLMWPASRVGYSKIHLMSNVQLLINT